MQNKTSRIVVLIFALFLMAGFGVRLFFAPMHIGNKEGRDFLSEIKKQTSNEFSLKQVVKGDWSEVCIFFKMDSDVGVAEGVLKKKLISQGLANDSLQIPTDPYIFLLLGDNSYQILSLPTNQARISGISYYLMAAGQSRSEKYNKCYPFKNVIFRKVEVYGQMELQLTKGDK